MLTKWKFTRLQHQLFARISIYSKVYKSEFSMPNEHKSLPFYWERRCNSDFIKTSVSLPKIHCHSLKSIILNSIVVSRKHDFRFYSFLKRHYVKKLPKYFRIYNISMVYDSQPYIIPPLILASLNNWNKRATLILSYFLRSFAKALRCIVMKNVNNTPMYTILGKEQ